MKMNSDPANRLQDFLAFGEFGGVNPSITDSSTFTFMEMDKMAALFEGEVEGCFLYARHTTPMNEYLGRALALMEGTEACHTTGSGIAAINCTIMQLCNAGDEIVSSRTIYGGTYALMKNFLPKFNINTHFVNITDLDQVKSKINEKTKVIYCETLSNPLLEVADIPELRKICDEHGLTLVVDNTFTPMVLTPYKDGAHVVVHSLTKYINGASDCVGGAICGDKDFILSLMNVNDGATMLLGPVLDSMRAASILKNLRTLHIRMKRHSENAMYVATKLHELGLKVFYPGFKTHPQHELMNKLMNPGYGYSGMITFDAKEMQKAQDVVIEMQDKLVGYFAVSLGFYKTLFSMPGTSTSSEIPKEEQDEMGLTESLVRFSMGLDQDIERTFERIEAALKKFEVI
jgi:methionine-gamma-lyase